MHRALFRFAEELASGAAGDREVRWRRAVSSAYYALFHLLVHEGTDQLKGVGVMDEGVRAMLSRSFDHGPMKTASDVFTKQINATSPLARLAIPAELRTVAKNFVQLQGMRHLADYDVGVVFDHLNTQLALRLAREAFTAWDTLRGSEAARVYIFLMLSKDGLSRAQQAGTALPTAAPPASPPPTTPPSGPAP